MRYDYCRVTECARRTDVKVTDISVPSIKGHAHSSILVHSSTTSGSCKTGGRKEKRLGFHGRSPIVRERIRDEHCAVSISSVYRLAGMGA
jgi:hypothetical protein